MQIKSVADIVGANATVQIANTGTARWLAFSASGGTGARVGDINTSSARGLLVPSGSSPTMVWAESVDLNDIFSLAQLYAYVPTGTTLSIQYGVVKP